MRLPPNDLPKPGFQDFLRTERARLLAYVRKRLSRLAMMDGEDVVSEVILGVLRRSDVAGEIANVPAYGPCP